MNLLIPNRARAGVARGGALVVAMAGWLSAAAVAQGEEEQAVMVRASGFAPGAENASVHGTNQYKLVLEAPNPNGPPYCQSVVKQGTEPAALGPAPAIPYFTVRFALPIPPENLTNNFAAATGIDPEVFTHNHSPGFEILPNGDALAVYFSTPPGKSEADPETSFVQARLRYGSEDWDQPELFFKTEGYNDQSGLLWNDGGTLRFFGGGRELSDWVPFKLAVSTDNGATWTLSLPQLAQPAEHFTAQPITSAFRAPDRSIYFAMDGEKATSFLWRSADNGVHWQQMEGRTGGRHSVIVPLDGKGNLLSIGGKNASVEGWSPENVSSNWGVSWSASVSSPFPPLGSAQRPSLIKLADGNLFFVSDAYLHKLNRPPPAGWTHGNGCFVALSTNRGASWIVKSLPVQLPNHERGTNGTLGYVTVRQAPNGVIHVLSTETEPCLHYELNEAWIRSDAGDIAAETSGGVVKSYTENYPNGKVRSRWQARICPHGRYLLNGPEVDFYPNGVKAHEVAYVNGRKNGSEIFWSSKGVELWTWDWQLKQNRAVWTRYWPNGRKRLESAWNTRPEARDLKRSFFGLVADGPAKQWAETGALVNSVTFVDGFRLETNVAAVLHATR